MLQVKIFFTHGLGTTAGLLAELEDTINSWLKKNATNIDVVSVNFSMRNDFYSGMVLYKTK